MWSFVDSLEGQHHRLELDPGRNRKPVEVMEEGGHIGEFGKIVNKACCSVPDTLQWFSCREGVAVVQAVDDQRLDQELCCIFY